MMTNNVRSLVDKNQDRGHQFSSATSYYRKLVNDSFMPFSYWNEMCRTGQLVRTQQKIGTCCRGSAHQTDYAKSTEDFKFLCQYMMDLFVVQI